MSRELRHPLLVIAGLDPAISVSPTEEADDPLTDGRQLTAGFKPGGDDVSGLRYRPPVTSMIAPVT